MSIEEILQLVSAELDINLKGLLKSRRDKVITAKFTAFLLMHEEGYTPAQIASALQVDRSGVYYALSQTSIMLEVDKPFKQAYLRCIARIAKKEDAVCA